jgi:hypothetical protein
MTIMFIEITEQQHAHILAALRYWSREGRFSAGHEQDIATDMGKYESLSEVQMDELCDKLNSGEPPVVTIGLNVQGGMVQNVITDAQGVAIDCIKVDWDTEGADMDELVPVNSPTMCDPDDAFVGSLIVDYSPEFMRCYRDARDERDRRDEVKANAETEAIAHHPV